MGASVIELFGMARALAGRRSAFDCIAKEHVLNTLRYAVVRDSWHGGLRLRAAGTAKIPGIHVVRYLAVALEYGAQTARLLDVGAGDGEVTRELAAFVRIPVGRLTDSIGLD